MVAILEKKLMTNNLKTKFAPPERLSQNKILEQSNIIIEIEYLKDILNALPYIGLILNKQRQIVFSNNAILDLIGFETIDKIIGKRPGEAINCIFSKLEPEGCGTSEYCCYCGAVNAILESQKNKKQISRECRITIKKGNEMESLDLMVTATPFLIKSLEFTIVAIIDISKEKRKKNLEKIFFHDIINTIGGIKGLIDFLSESDNEMQTFKELLPIIHSSINQLLEEILAQRQLILAENNELKIEFKNINSLELLENLKKTYTIRDISHGKFIEISKNSEEIEFKTDITLIKRILGNMIKNALEASTKGQTVTLNAKKIKDKIQFCVHNNTFIPKDIKLQIFQRSFSTKGDNRGLGTYSMKLLTERYLKGNVIFETSQDKGTYFYLTHSINS